MSEGPLDSTSELTDRKIEVINTTLFDQKIQKDSSPVGAGIAMAPPDFERSVNPISTRRADYAHHITTGPPGFSEIPTALDSEHDSSLKHQMSNTASSSSVIAASLTSTSSSESSRFVEFLKNVFKCT